MQAPVRIMNHYAVPTFFFFRIYLLVQVYSPECLVVLLIRPEDLYSHNICEATDHLFIQI